MALPILGPILELGNKLIDRFIPDPVARDAARLELAKMESDGALTEFQGRISVIVAEASSRSWLTNSWRPITMLALLAIPVNNYILLPWLRIFGVDAPMLDVPVNVWDIIQTGLGGYVVGRSVEKVADKVATALKKKL